MGVMIGFIVGYVLGTRAGDKGAAELKEAWHAIRTSDEARSLVAQGVEMTKGVVQQAPTMLRDRLQSKPSGETSAALRPSG
ncbi:MAG TPA: hypothetical protein VIT64_04625 [Ilumatobacteraceae bacterium]|jgi:hypothetical protein